MIKRSVVRCSAISLNLILLSLLGIPAFGLESPLPSEVLVAQGLGRPRPPGNPGTGTSGPCSPEQSLLPVTPSEPQEGDRTLYAGKTSDAHPTLWFYVPYEAVVSARFSLTEWQERQQTTAARPLYTTTLTLPSASPGILRIPIPPTVTLDSDRWYEARLSIRVICQAGFAPEAEFTRLWVRREAIDPELNSRLLQASTPLQRATVYARAGFWFDALKTLIPNNTSPNSSDWTSLLREFGIADPVVSAPLRN